jgi:polar amino acid transport system permease protein
MLAPVVNLIVDLIPATTLASLIGVGEVLQRSRQAVEYYQLSAGDGHAAPIFAGVLLFFFVICYPLTVLARRMEIRTSREAPRSSKRTRMGRPVAEPSGA